MHRAAKELSKPTSTGWSRDGDDIHTDRQEDRAAQRSRRLPV